MTTSPVLLKPAPSYEVAVAYRIYPAVGRATPVYTDDKERLARLCLRSFVKFLGDVKAKLWVVLDDCPPFYREMFLEHFDAGDLVFVPLPRTGNSGTFAKQIELLLAQTDAEHVYLAEDDYFYLVDGCRAMLAFANSHETEVDFVTPYDHPDYYDAALHPNPCLTKFHGGRHWRTTDSTCLTFLTRRKVLREAAAAFHAYGWVCGDHEIWMGLSKGHRYLIRKLVRLFRRTVRGHPVKAHAFAVWRELQLRRYRLWSPMPTLATHMVTGFLAPGVDWLPAFQET